jgi:arylsulfatase A-like enzyme
MTQNVVIIIMDTVRAVGSDPTSDYRKLLPTIFDTNTTSKQTFTSTPWTFSANASLLSAITPSKHGAHAGHKQLDETLTTLPEVLQIHDYETVAVSNNR